MLNDLTQERLKELFHYDPETGIFTFLIDSGRRKSGDECDYVTPLGYMVVAIDGKKYRLHRLAWLYMYGKFPDGLIDHINHVTTDNRISNLRDVTDQENSLNQLLQKDNKIGVSGIHKHKKGGFVARISYQNERIYLGYFSDKFEAICARKSAERKYGFHENHGGIL